MTRVRMEDLWRLLPALEELEPLLGLLLARSEPDPERTWSSAGEVETAGDRRLTGMPSVDDARRLADGARDHLEAVLTLTADAIRALSSGDGAEAGRLFLEIGALEERRGRWDRAGAWARAAFDAARDVSDSPWAAVALRRQGRAARAQGDLVVARTHYEAGYGRARLQGDLRGAAEGAIGAGNVLEQQGRWHEAERWYRVALDLLAPLQVPVPERWHAFLNLHIALRSRGDLETSRPFLDRAVEEAEAVGDREAAPFLLNARGQLEALEGRPGQAETTFRRALDAASSVGAAVTIRLNLGESLLASGRFLEAAEEGRVAEADAIRGGLSHLLPEVYRLLGRVAAERGSPEAFALFERALELLRTGQGSMLEEAVTLQAYARAERLRGEEEAARELLDRAMTLYGELGISGPRHPWTDYFGPREPGSASTSSTTTSS